jgi:transcription antitermination factor NusA-like protein
VKLASKLTRYNLDVKSVSEMEQAGGDVSAFLAEAPAAVVGEDEVQVSYAEDEGLEEGHAG